MADLRSGDGPCRPAGPRCCTRVRASRAAERRSIRMAKRGDKPSKQAERPRGGVVETVTDVIVDADGTVTPVSGRTAKELHKLEKKLAAARKTEAKRLRQLQAAEGTKGRKQVAKRTRQATDAANEVSSLSAKLQSAAAEAAGSAAATAAPPAVSAPAAPAPAPRATTPRATTPRATTPRATGSRTTRSSSARKPATTRRAPAAAAAPRAATPAPVTTPTAATPRPHASRPLPGSPRHARDGRPPPGGPPPPSHDAASPQPPRSQ